MRWLVASVVATWLASGAAWGHRFPEVRTVVLQVERCELAVLVGFRPASGEATEQVVARAASRPKSQALEAMRDLLAAQAMAPLAVTVDGAPLVPTAVRAKLGSEGAGGRPIVVVLVTYALPPGKRLAVATSDPRTTRISWTDRDSHRVVISEAPAQGRWFTGVASFLLNLAPGGPCVSTSPSSPR